MKILHIFDHSIPLHSGYTFRSRAILEHQRKLGWTTEHITSPKHNQATKPDGKEEEIDGFHFYRTEPSKGLFSKLPILNQLSIVSALEARLEAVIKEIKPDILHAHSPALNGRAAVNVGKKYGIPVVYEIRAFWEDAAVDHGTTTEGSLRYRLTRAMETKVIREADAVTTICEGLRSDIVARGVLAEKVGVIPNAVDIERFPVCDGKEAQLEKKHGLIGKIVIGFIGSFYAYEGIPQLIEAISLLSRDRDDIVLLLVGGGPQDAYVRQLIKDKQLEDKVILPGRIPHEIVQQYYSLVDIFAYPRLPMRLTHLVTPLKPLEAMAQKRLVVASDVGGHKELIEDGKTGVLFEAGNPNALADAITKLIDSRDSWEAMHDAGRDFVENVRNWENSVANYEAIYKRVIASQ
ncbi:MAG: glycosyltransferase, exosortase A system-associated [Gammaproteobacteria bacterium]|nr:glycosyltransferase, exosortase A system-associated [Gammaproteobacteria bacterium]